MGEGGGESPAQASAHGNPPAESRAGRRARGAAVRADASSLCSRFSRAASAEPLPVRPPLWEGAPCAPAFPPVRVDRTRASRRRGDGGGTAARRRQRPDRGELANLQPRRRRRHAAGPSGDSHGASAALSLTAAGHFSRERLAASLRGQQMRALSPNDRKDQQERNGLGPALAQGRICDQSSGQILGFCERLRDAMSCRCDHQQETTARVITTAIWKGRRTWW